MDNNNPLLKYVQTKKDPSEMIASGTID